MIHELLVSVRSLWKRPGFSAVAVFTLALGIGANTLVFVVAKAVLFRPLGFAQEDRLMWLRLTDPRAGREAERLSWRDLKDLRERTRSFERITTFGASGALWRSGDRLEPAAALRVTAELPEMLGARVVLGRGLHPADTIRGAPPVALLSHALWRSRFGAASNVLGQSVWLEDAPHTIVGVLPPGFEFPLERAPAAGTGSELTPSKDFFWLPLAPPTGEDLISRSSRMYLAVAQLKAGVTEVEARADLAAVSQDLARAFPETNREWTFELTSFRDQILGRTRIGIPLLGMAVAAVLLVCCVNLANLLLARGLARQREWAVRLALGARRRQLARTVLWEAGVLALAGSVVGILLVQRGLSVLRIWAPGQVPFVGEAVLDPMALVFAGGLAVLAAVLFGTVPALCLSRVAVAGALHGGVRRTDGPSIRVWQQGFLIGQIGLVLVLVVSGGLLLESYRRLIGQDLGYRPASVVTLDVETWGFPTNEAVCRFYRRVRERLAAIPGVEAVGTISSVPLTGRWTFDERAQVVGRPVPPAERPALAATIVAFDYFEVMSIPVLEGRTFAETELSDLGYGQQVVLNQAAAKVLFPGRSAVGGRFTVGSNPDRELEVIGVVKDTRDVRLEAAPEPRFYWQYAFNGAQVVVRTSASFEAIAPLLRDTVLRTDSRVIFRGGRALQEVVSDTVAERRFLMSLLVVYALVALGIAVVGVGGVVAHQVAQRTQEFGIRLALGSTPAALLNLVSRQTLRTVATGVLVGLFLAFGAGRVLAAHLFGVSPQDPAVLGVVVSLLVVLSLAVTRLSARPATRVDPVVVLRAE